MAELDEGVRQLQNSYSFLVATCLNLVSTTVKGEKVYTPLAVWRCYFIAKNNLALTERQKEEKRCDQMLAQRLQEAFAKELMLMSAGYRPEKTVQQYLEEALGARYPGDDEVGRISPRPASSLSFSSQDLSESDGEARISGGSGDIASTARPVEGGLNDGPKLRNHDGDSDTLEESSGSVGEAVSSDEEYEEKKGRDGFKDVGSIGDEKLDVRSSDSVSFVVYSRLWRKRYRDAFGYALSSGKQELGAFLNIASERPEEMLTNMVPEILTSQAWTLLHKMEHPDNEKDINVRGYRMGLEIVDAKVKEVGASEEASSERSSPAPVKFDKAETFLQYLNVCEAASLAATLNANTHLLMDSEDDACLGVLTSQAMNRLRNEIFPFAPPHLDGKVSFFWRKEYIKFRKTLIH